MSQALSSFLPLKRMVAKWHFIRHAEPVDLGNSSLSERGQQQAQLLGEYLQKSCCVYTRVFKSNLDRAKEVRHYRDHSMSPLSDMTSTDCKYRPRQSRPESIPLSC